MIPAPRLLKVAEVAELLGVSRRTIYKWARSGVLPSVKIGGVLRFKPDAVTALIDGKEQEE